MTKASCFSQRWSTHNENTRSSSKNGDFSAQWRERLYWNFTVLRVYAQTTVPSGNKRKKLSSANILILCVRSAIFNVECTYLTDELDCATQIIKRQISNVRCTDERATVALIYYRNTIHSSLFFLYLIMCRFIHWSTTVSGWITGWSKELSLFKVCGG